MSPQLIYRVAIDLECVTILFLVLKVLLHSWYNKESNGHLFDFSSFAYTTFIYTLKIHYIIDKNNKYNLKKYKLTYHTFTGSYTPLDGPVTRCAANFSNSWHCKAATHCDIHIHFDQAQTNLQHRIN